MKKEVHDQLIELINDKGEFKNNSISVDLPDSFNMSGQYIRTVSYTPSNNNDKAIIYIQLCNRDGDFIKNEFEGYYFNLDDYDENVITIVLAIIKML